MCFKRRESLLIRSANLPYVYVFSIYCLVIDSSYQLSGMRGGGGKRPPGAFFKLAHGAI